MVLPSSGNPFECHDKVLYLQTMIPCSECLDAFRFFFLHLPVNVWTYQPNREEVFFFFLQCFYLNFLSREGFSRPFPSSAVMSNFVYPRHNCCPLVGHVVRENPSSCDCAEIRTHVPTSEGFEVYQLTHRGDRLLILLQYYCSENRHYERSKKFHVLALVAPHCIY